VSKNTYSYTVSFRLPAK